MKKKFQKGKTTLATKKPRSHYKRKKKGKQSSSLESSMWKCHHQDPRFSLQDVLRQISPPNRPTKNGTVKDHSVDQ